MTRLNTTKSKQRPRRAMSAEMTTLLEDQCTTKALTTLLRDAKAAKPDDGVKITAKNKEELISENLRKAVASGAIALADVEQMLLESEENGRQVVLFYQVTDDDLKSILSDPAAVAEKLFEGSGWEEKDKYRFPLFREKPKGEVWSDFRVEDEGWVAKLYRGDSRWVIDPDESKETQNRRVRVWVRRYARDVFLYRWHGNGIFEIRAPRVDGRRELVEVMKIAWGGLRTLADKAGFDEYHLTKAISFLAHDDDRLDGEIALGPARLADSAGGPASFSPRTSQRYLHESEEHKKAIKIFKLCEELAVYWLRPSDDDDEKERVKSLVGYHGFKNCILIPARVGSANANYATNRLLQIEAEQRRTNSSN